MLSSPRNSFGAPVDRRRLYVIMVEESVLKAKDQGFEAFIG